MPLINGKKMACEPCIRGHRSTTCNHANERVMVPVRKPGRPLNECPHPRGSKCGCRDLTVAIPRKRKCECSGTGEKRAPAQVPASKIKSEAARPATATSPVKERSSKPASQDPDALRNPSARAPTVPAVTSPPQADLNGLGAQWNVNWNWSYGCPNQPSVGPFFQGFSSPPAPRAEPQRKSMSAGAGDANSLNTATPPVVAVDDTNKQQAKDEGAPRPSCCSSRSTSTAQPLSTPGNVTPDSSSSSYTSHSRSSSRSRGPSIGLNSQTSPRIGIAPHAAPEPTARPPSFPVMVPNMSAQVPLQPISATPPACTNCGHNQPPILIYLPFGLPSQPLSYAPSTGPVFLMQQGVMQHGAAQNAAAQHATTSIPSATDLSRNQLSAITVPMGTCGSDNGNPIHECHCGPGCQCIGCIAHPFNDATREYIQSAQNAFEDFGQPFGAISELDTSTVPTTQAISNLALSPEQILAPEDFFFVDYSIQRNAYPG